MPQNPIIPGGRPRASSDGDILDEGFCGTILVNSNRPNRNYTEGHRKNLGRTGNVIATINNKNNAGVNNLSDDECDSDSKLSSQSHSSARSGRKGLTFKSMRKIVSRVFVKDPKFTDSAVKHHEKSAQASGKVWTPDLRHLGERIDNKSSGTSSTARPLVSNLNIGMAVPKWKTTPGAVGIDNHGNNCFMNTVLQCLSNTDSFTEYFIRDFFKIDLKNSANGKKGVFRSSHGEVTEQLGHFLKCLWSGKYSSEVSKEFKFVIGKFNNQYKGEDQHDAQEFLLWLLDHIHEDVSTFTKKKLKPLKVPLVKTDKELAAEVASLNGESFILRLFQALHTSSLTCPTCGEYSSTFDPYLCVSLPLPQRCLRIVYVVVVSLDFQEVKMAFTLYQNDEVKKLRELVAADAEIPLDQLLLVQLKGDGFGATYSEEQPLSDIPENEVVYAVEAHPENSDMHGSTQEFDSPIAQVLLIHVEVRGKSAHRFGCPVMLKVRRDITWRSLQMEILEKMDGSLSEDIFHQTQKLNGLFLLRIYDGSSRKYYLSSDVEMPLYSQSVERAYALSDKDSGPPHIKIIAEWGPQTKSRVVLDDQEHIEISTSVIKAQNNPAGQGKISLEECFRLYTQEEKLIGDDAWLCPHCKKQQQGTIKTLGLWSLPEILVLHLKRFKQTGLRRSKLNTLIDFPIDGLDMSCHLSRQSHGHPFKGNDYIYDLIGVSNHYGNMMGGHYMAYCRNPIDGKWREYNDARVRILEGPVATREAYILFYQRRSLSKNVNQRLSSGDHWIYSLPLAPAEGTREILTSGTSRNSNLELTHQARHSRSRSASPSTRRQNKGWNTHCIPIHLLTPQPVRRPMMSSISDEDISDNSMSTSSSAQNSSANHRSRPIQRPSFDSRSQFSHETSARDSSSVHVKNPSKAHFNRRSPSVDKKGFVADHSKMIKPKLSSSVTKSEPQTSSRTTDIDKPPPVMVPRHDLPMSSDFGVSTSRTGNHHSSLNSVIQESHATYPSSSNPTSVLQMKVNNKNISNSPKLYHDSPSLSDAENAGKKLAHIITQDIMNRAPVCTDTAEDQNNFVRSEFRKCSTENSLDCARLKQVNVDNHLDGAISQASTNGSSHHLDSSDSDSNSKDSEFKRKNWYNVSVRFGHKDAGHAVSSEDCIIDSDLSQRISVQSGIRHKLQNGTNSAKPHRLPEKQFEGVNGSFGNSKKKQTSRFADDTDIRNSDNVNPLVKGDVSFPNKSATISRIYNTSKGGRFEQTNIPHSNTDHNIRYSNSSFAPPPSPAPPHNLQEERSFIRNAVSSSIPSSTSDYFTSSHLAGGDTHSNYSSEFTEQHSSHWSSLTSAGRQTLPGYIPGSRESRYNFHRPRGIYTGKVDPATRNPGKVSNPCLRESSV